MIDRDHMREWIWQRASNDGDNYTASKEVGPNVAAAVAAQKAYVEYVQAVIESIGEEWNDGMSDALEANLAQRWRST